MSGIRVLAANWKVARSWRRWMPGPKHRVARGVVVLGSPGFGADLERLGEVLGRCEDLRSWARAHGIALTGVTDDLVRRGQTIDEWGGGPAIATAWATRPGCSPAA